MLQRLCTAFNFFFLCDCSMWLNYWAYGIIAWQSQSTLERSHHPCNHRVNKMDRSGHHHVLFFELLFLSQSALIRSRLIMSELRDPCRLGAASAHIAIGQAVQEMQALSLWLIVAASASAYAFNERSSSRSRSSGGSDLDRDELVDKSTKLSGNAPKKKKKG